MFLQPYTGDLFYIFTPGNGISAGQTMVESIINAKRPNTPPEVVSMYLVLVLITKQLQSLCEGLLDKMKNGYGRTNKKMRFKH